MTREDYLKAKIKEYGMTQREFAANIGMPSSTLFSILRNVGGASIDNIIKICRGLNISPEDLANVGEPITLPTNAKGITLTLRLQRLLNTCGHVQMHTCYFLLQRILVRRIWRRLLNTLSY